MRELAFLLTGLSENDARKWRRRSPGRSPVWVAGWVLLGVALLYLPGGAKAVRLEITSPSSGSTTLNAQVLVAGRATGVQADVVTLEVNGSQLSAPLLNGAFEARVSLVLGDNSIRATANDVSSEPTTVTRRPPPSIRIDSPLEKARTIRPEIDVIGTVENSDVRAVTLDVNGAAHEVPVTDSRFSAKATLVTGRNVIRALVAGASSAAIEVFRVGTGIAITSPSNGYATDREAVTVSGTVENAEAGEVALKSNGFSRSVPLQNGRFTTEVVLNIGDNKIKASLSDGLSDEIVVHRTLPPVIITLTSPPSGPTQSATASVRGTVQNARSSAVTLRVNASSLTVLMTGGSFAAEVPLEIGDNHIQASQGDAVSNRAVVNRQPPPTLIGIISPGSGPTQASSIRVRGTVANPRGDTITLTVNGSSRSVPLTRSGFVSTVELAFGENRIQASQGIAVSNKVIVSRAEPRPTLIRITSPRTGATREPSVRVTGAIVNQRGDTITLTINGSPRTVQITNGAFSYDLRLGFGDTSIQASQGDAVSNEVIVTRANELRTQIRITSPRTGATKEPTVRVTGAIVNPRGDTITLTINGSPRTVQINNGAFSYDLRLGFGDTRIQASQGDAVSNEVIVTRANEPRTLIRITSPKTGATKEPSIRVTGAIVNQRGDTITLTINGSPRTVQITNGAFSYDLRLGFGDTRIQASQGDAVSNEVVVSRGRQTGGDNPPPPSECSKINCDCRNLRASQAPADAWSVSFSAQALSFPASAGPLQDRQAVCRAAEEKLRQRCKETGKVSGTCPPDASGPNAWPSTKPRSPNSKK